jgi:hypothetical protein
MAPKPKRRRTSGFAAQRELIAMAKTMNLAAIVKKTGRTPKSIMITANRLSLSIKGRK